MSATHLLQEEKRLLRLREELHSEKISFESRKGSIQQELDEIEQTKLLLNTAAKNMQKKQQVREKIW